ncbi:MAG: elongation factor 4 [Coriobacteriaceae bacterium]|jgi:GTP-binding protein LepA|uniref:translation elongation factor 4 n=1 Tax=Olsenella kribbiana TaxID=3115221 RepID=UPI000FF158D4|nr:translation elongation factor 4 [Atopobium sp.]MCH3926114.1 translation elongation factor 4 [Atopobiaceae bacterium]MCI6262522.1 translation elongation factor 4 [Olsenella sp.]RRF95821.1 MAG: elongation factor 4 [Coriobacteriaceae bacterium]MCH4081267.1 translation elongation factor 4 [Atopobiaceae bacterium]
MSIDTSHIRNFSIVAHIDHGKSTISDRILELTHTVEERDLTSQMLDSMDIEQERGITIKSNAVRVMYDADDGETYLFNLIDTPGHVDFTYEVSRSLAACEGAVLVVDATQGVEAQTVSNATLAMNAGLDIVPCINKIDLPSAHPEEVKQEIEDDLAIPAEDAVLVSGKTGEGIHDLLEAIVYLISPPKGDENAPLKALILDSYFDEYRGVVATVRVFDGHIRKGDHLKMMAIGDEFLADGVGCKRPLETPLDELSVGEVGYVVTGLKDPEMVRTGDTITDADNPCAEACPGYHEAKPMVFTGLFPIDTKDYENLRDALEKLKVNDPSLTWSPENSVALGFGFRVGFLGLLHMEVVKERLEREFGLSLIATSPSVEYHVFKTDGTMEKITSPQDLPEPTRIDHIEEPYLKAKVIVPPEYMGPVMQLVVDHRGTTQDMVYLSEKSVELHFDIPLAELILDFFDQLKSRTKGYASLDYEIGDYRTSDLVKLDILLAGEEVDALSFIVHRDKAYDLARGLCDKLKEIIPRQQFEVPIQGAIGNKIISRSTVKAVRKDVLAKCYGGDITRKRKLLEKQKEGKKRMKAIGTVEVPQEAFLAVLKVDDE